MKRILSFFLLLFVSVGIAQAQSEDEGIKTCLNNYLEGITKGDTARLNRAFHPSALLKTVSSQSGKVQDFQVKSFVAKTPAGGLQASTRILSYNYAGIAASAAVELSMTDFKYIDLLSLLKVNGEWKIVCRVFSRTDSTTELVSPYGSVAKSGGSKPASSSAPASTPKPKAKPKAADDWK
jgi:Putative lumazine-binding